MVDRAAELLIAELLMAELPTAKEETAVIHPTIARTDTTAFTNPNHIECDR